MDGILLPNEIEMFIDSMKPQKLKDIGSHQWLDWHERLQKLNQQALMEATVLKEEQVKETLVSYGKVPVLIHEALLINLWKFKVLPHLLDLEPHPESTIMAYSILYHEAVCIALLELVMFHLNCCETLEESAADLLDYLSGSTAHLLSVKQTEAEISENAKLELLRQAKNLTFDIGIRSLSIVRYLAEGMDSLPIGITRMFFCTHDIPVLFSQILIASPWKKDGKLYCGGQWKEWDNEQLGQAEAQVWLTLRHLLLDPECPKNYTITDSRRSQLLKLLPLISPILLDQLSPLIELKQWLHQLSAMQQPAAHPNPILLEPILEIKNGILQQAGGKWKKIAQSQLSVVFSNDKKNLQEIARKLSEAYNTDALEKIQTDKTSALCDQCGKNAIQRCSRCKKSWYCSRSCQVTHWPQHKDSCQQ